MKKPKKTILVVDDEMDFLCMMERHLRERGYQVVTAADGEAGHRLAEVYKPDLITLDLSMPRKDGLELYSLLLTRHGRPRFPVLAITAREDLKQTLLSLDVDGFISKPFEVKDLVREIDRILTAPKRIRVYVIDRKDGQHTYGIVKALEEELYEVTVANDLGEFRDLISVNSPDFIFMEYLQSSMNSETLIQEVKQIAGTTHPAAGDKPEQVPIVAYSYSGMDYTRKSMDAGCDKFLFHPGQYDAFVETVREFEIRKRCA